MVARMFAGAIISHRTALSGGMPTETGEIFLTHKYAKKVQWPGLTIRLLEGPGPVDGDNEIFADLFMASKPRAFLECLQIGRSRAGGSAKNLPLVDIEERLEEICRVRGEEELNALRDQARALAPKLALEESFEKLNGIIGAILRTRPAEGLSSPTAIASAKGEQYDPARLELFDSFRAYLSSTTLPKPLTRQLSTTELGTLAFFEAYFSNYIEGTEFEVSEAYDIVMHNKVPETRPEDAHDILGTHRIVSNSSEMGKTPGSIEDFVSLLKNRHFSIMEGRPSVEPGKFKTKVNRAGNTEFVSPSLVRGTLKSGLDLSRGVEPGLARALFMMFVVSEVHPFNDGNGRVARVFLNAELVSVGESRIILPTVLRDEYLDALRALSRKSWPDPLVRVMRRAQEFTQDLPLSTFEEANRTLAACNAFQGREEDDVRLLLPREVMG